MSPPPRRLKPRSAVDGRSLAWCRRRWPVVLLLTALAANAGVTLLPTVNLHIRPKKGTDDSGGSEASALVPPVFSQHHQVHVRSSHRTHSPAAATSAAPSIFSSRPSVAPTSSSFTSKASNSHAGVSQLLHQQHAPLTAPRANLPLDSHFDKNLDPIKMEWHSLTKTQHHPKSKRRMPYDIDQAASWEAMYQVHLNRTLPLLLTQSDVHSDTFRRADGLEYYNAVRVAKKTSTEIDEDNEDEASPQDATTDESGTQRLVYRLHRSMYEQLPAEQPNWEYDRCAVVGNSGVMLSHRFGVEIDAHDAVLRINNAPLKRFTPFVGNKTTFNLVNQHWAKELAAERVPLLHPDASVLVFESTFTSVRTQAYAKLLQLFPSRALLFAPELTITAHTLWLKLKALVEQENREKNAVGEGMRLRTAYKRKPMTGFFGVLFALQLCHELDLYGFSDYNRHESNGARQGKVPYHYFDSVPGTTKVHSFDLSLEVFKLMQRVHNITLKT